jgi:hypothetical protein
MLAYGLVADACDDKIRLKKTKPLNDCYDLWKLFKTSLSMSMLKNYCEFI